MSQKGQVSTAHKPKERLLQSVRDAPNAITNHNITGRFTLN